MASGVFDSVMRPMYLDYLSRALKMLSQEEHEIYDIIIARLFPARAERKRAESEAGVKNVEVMVKRAQRKQEAKDRKARGRKRAAEMSAR